MNVRQIDAATQAVARADGLAPDDMSKLTRDRCRRLAVAALRAAERIVEKP